MAIGRRDVKGWVEEDRLDMSSSSFMKTLKKRVRHGCKDPRVSSLGRCDDNIVHSIGCSDFTGSVSMLAGDSMFPHW